jgi:hypothetical protein
LGRVVITEAYPPFSKVSGHFCMVGSYSAVRRLLKMTSRTGVVKKVSTFQTLITPPNLIFLKKLPFILFSPICSIN